MQQDFTIQDASTSAENFSCSEKGLGATCGAVISMSGWKIPEDYPFEF